MRWRGALGAWIALAALIICGITAWTPQEEQVKSAAAFERFPRTRNARDLSLLNSSGSDMQSTSWQRKDLLRSTLQYINLLQRKAARLERLGQEDNEDVSVLFYSEHYPNNPFVPHDFNLEADCPHFGYYSLPKCQFTTDRTLLPKAQAVVFHGDHFTESSPDMPRSRAEVAAPEEQLWVWADIEPVRTPPELYRYKETPLFNLSATYMRDSDIDFRYGRFRTLSVQELPTRSQWEKDVRSMFNRKTRAAAWVVAHCHTRSHREEYVQLILREFRKAALNTTVDIHGCPELFARQDPRHKEHDDHMRLLNEEYFTYLAFENCLCQDYITEKAWLKSLVSGAIPIVRGGKTMDDYILSLPPKSFINTRSFYSPAALVQHMLALMKDFSLFSSYHEWRMTHALVMEDGRHWSVHRQQEKNFICNLCFQMATERRPKNKHFNASVSYNPKDRCVRSPPNLRW